jgi:DNA ligase D-like protein (predicted 3'-phosphoesterase)
MRPVPPSEDTPRHAARLWVAAPDASDRLPAAAVRERAQELGLLGWVRGDAAGNQPLAIHVEGNPAALDRLVALLGGEERVSRTRAKVEGHEQFGIRGVIAGAFVVQEHQATAHHFDLRLEVDGVMRSWAVPKGPSLDPAAKRLAVQVADHGIAHNTFEGPTDGGGVIVWDRGGYEQGGRVPWPEAIERGHAVFVLRGEKLHGGFALQRTGPAAGEPSRRSPSRRLRTASESQQSRSAGELPRPRSQWLLVKRRDDDARPGGDIVAERPESVASGRTLAQLLGAG